MKLITKQSDLFHRKRKGAEILFNQSPEVVDFLGRQDVGITAVHFRKKSCLDNRRLILEGEKLHRLACLGGDDLAGKQQANEVNGPAHMVGQIDPLAGVSSPIADQTDRVSPAEKTEGPILPAQTLDR